MSAQDHEIMTRHFYAMESAGLAQLRHFVINYGLAFAVKDTRSQDAQHWLIAGADANLALHSHFSISHLAILSGSQACHSLLLEYGANPNACEKTTRFSTLMLYQFYLILQDVPGRRIPQSPLAYAVKLDRQEIAQNLLRAGADVKVSKKGDLLTAMEGGIDRFLENVGTRRLCSPLAYAIRLDYREIARDLLQAGADVVDIKEDDFPTATEGDHLSRVRCLDSPLAYAIKLDRRALAWDLLEAGADVSDFKEEEPKLMESALQYEDPYRVYYLSFGGYYKRHKEPILYYYPSLYRAVTVSEAHFDRSSVWPHLYQQDRLSRDDFMALWTSLHNSDKSNNF